MTNLTDKIAMMNCELCKTNTNINNIDATAML